MKNTRRKLRGSNCFPALLVFLSVVLPGSPVWGRSWGLGVGAHTGFLAAHNPTMLHLLDSHIGGLELTVYRQTDGDASWHSVYRYPQTGLNFLYLDLPSDTILGKAYAVMAFIDMPLWRSRAWQLSVRSSAGLGYLTGSFQRVENYKNTAIGSPLNAAVQFELENSFRVTPLLDLQLSIGLTHFSNGSFATPNLGLNNFTASAGIRYLVAPPDSFFHGPEPERPANWFTEIVVAAGTKEIYPPDDGKYFSATLEATRMKQVSRKSRFGYGADLFYDGALNVLIEKKTGEPSDVVQVRAGVHGSYQLVISRISALLDCGIYLLDPYDGQGLFYHRIGLRYQATGNVFLNLSLKTHFAKAEYAEWGLGLNLDQD